MPAMITRRIVCAAARSERRGRFLDFVSRSSMTGCSVRTTKGSPTKISATRSPAAYRRSYAERLEMLAEPAVGP